MYNKSYDIATLIRKILLYLAIFSFLIFFYLFTLAFNQNEKMEIRSDILAEKFTESQNNVDILYEEYSIVQHTFRLFSNNPSIKQYENYILHLDNFKFYIDSIITRRKEYIQNLDLGYINIEYHEKILNSYILLKNKVEKVILLDKQAPINDILKVDKKYQNLELKKYIDSTSNILHEVNLIIIKLNKDRYAIRQEVSKAEKQKLFEDSKKLKLLTALSISFMFILICIIIYYQYFTAVYIQKLNNQKNYANKLADKNAHILSQITHEIRTPINALIGILDIIKKKVSFNDEKDKALIDSSYSNIVNTSKTINDILDLHTYDLEENKYSHFEIETLLTEIFAFYDSQAKIKNIQLKGAIDENIATVVFSDKTKIKQIISSLLSNAIKFTEKGEVFCQIKIISDSILQIIIKDDGIGIPSEIQNNIYKKYYTAEDNNKYSNGIGLGLYITKKIVDSLHGKIRVNSIVKGGTTFSIDIPIPKPEYKKVENQKEKNINDLPHSLSWLLIDDNALNLFYLKQFFTNFSNLRTAKNGAEGLEIIKNEDIDIIITDINMPVMTGDELLVQIRTEEKYNYIKIIATSSDNSQIKKLEKQHNQYFDGILIKPFNEKDLTEIIFNTLKTE